MARVAFIVEDAFSGERCAGINLTLLSEPDFAPGDLDLTPAQSVALRIVNFVRTMGTNVAVTQEAEKFVGAPPKAGN
jgi:hypothetical protein